MAESIRNSTSSAGRRARPDVAGSEPSSSRVISPKLDAAIGEVSSAAGRLMQGVGRDCNERENARVACTTTTSQQ
jgi:hypothetical protein